MKRVIRVIQWILSIMVLFMGLVFFAGGFLPGLLGSVAGVILLPSVTKRIPRFKFRKVCICVLSFVLFVMAGSNLPEAPADETPVISTSQPAQSTETTCDDSLSTTETTQKPTEATQEPTEATQEPTETTQKPTEATQKPTEVTQKPTEAVISASFEKKVSKYLKKKNYDSLISLYQASNDIEKSHITEKTEQHLIQLLQDDGITAQTTENLYALTDQFVNAGLTTETIMTVQDTLCCLDVYYNSIKSLPAEYSGPIKAESQIITQEVYVAVRVGDSLFEGQYTDYYGAYTKWDTLMGERYPDYDSEMIIIYSEEPLTKGFNYLTMVEDGTYKTVSEGFEETHRKFVTYSEEEWTRYYLSDYHERKRNALHNATAKCKEAIDCIATGDLETAKTLVDNSGQEYAAIEFVGEWGDRVSQRAYMSIAYDGNLFHINIRWSSSASEYSEWTMSGKYDASIHGIVYEDGSCKNYTDDAQVTSFTDSVGTLVLQSNGELLWEDNKDAQAKNCVFIFEDPT